MTEKSDVPHAPDRFHFDIHSQQVFIRVLHSLLSADEYPSNSKPHHIPQLDIVVRCQLM